MEAALGKIRPHTSSSLAHQKAPANLLVAIEATLDGQKSERSPTAYFATLLTTLESSVKDNQIALGEGDLLPAELYLLCLLAPFVPIPVIKTHLLSFLDLTAPLFPLLEQHNAPALRSQLGIYHVVFTNIDRQQLEVQGIRQCFASILELCLDHRPKVRKRAQEVVRDVLAAPPPPLGIHPYSQRVAEWIIQHLSQASTGTMFKKDKHAASGDGVIHVLALLRSVVITLPPSSLPQLSSLLLSLPRLGDTYVAQSAYKILAELFSLSEEATTDIQPADILEAIIASPPNKLDHVITPSWAIVLGEALLATYGKNALDHDQLRGHLQKSHSFLSSFFESPNSATRKAIVACYSNLCKCFTPALVREAVEESGKGKSEKSRNIILQLVAYLTRSLDTISYVQVNAIPELLETASSLFLAMGEFNVITPSKTISAAESLLLPFLKDIAALRIQKSFTQKEAADQVLCTAMRVLGPAVILRDDVLPLNLIPAKSSGDSTARAFLLPLLSQAQTHPSPLKHFVDYFVPLSEQLFELQQNAESDGKDGEAKVWSVLLSQIWSGLGGYVRSQPGDLSEALTPQFAQLLSNLLYSQLELRPAILKALRLLVETNVSSTTPVRAVDGTGVPASSSGKITVRRSVDDYDSNKSKNVEFLKSQAESWLAVFFNLYGSLSNAGKDNNTRALVGEVISTWSSVAGPDHIAKAFGNVLDLFKKNLPRPNLAKANADNTTAILSLDIIIVLLPYLAPSQLSEVFQLALSPNVLTSKDTALVKRGYRLLGKVVETRSQDVAGFSAVTVLEQLNVIGDEAVGAGSGGAKKDRLHLLRVLIPLLPPDAMHMIPSIIPEAVLGTKEPAEKARSEAFEVVVAMGKKMQAGGVVKRALLNDDGDASMGDDTEAAANVEEFLTMIAGGLAGGSPHMISASITAISRLVFEFKDEISAKLHGEMLSALLVFLASNNREIVKSALGYVKLIIHTLPVEVLRLHLKDLVHALLRWSGDRKNHFKIKVRHIFERMLRRFAWEEVFSCVEDPNAEEAKILINIKKRKDRAKRKKAKAEEEQEDEEPSAPPKKLVPSGDAFEDVLYGSESELEDSDDDDVPVTRQPTKGKGRGGDRHGARLRIDGDEPMDLLQGASAAITHGKDRRKHAGQDASRFKTNDDGKMIIAENEAEEEAGEMEGTEGNAYKESLTSVDGFVRGAKGQVKFNKDTKKRRREAEDEDGDVDMTDVKAAAEGKRARRQDSAGRLGSEFKAKRAGGDVKKGKVDPYAYVSLSQAAKRQKGGKMGIAGKRQK